MTYKCSMNIFVLDRNNEPIPGAIVVVSADGKARVRGKTSGYVNAPLKLRFNSNAAKIQIKVEYEGHVAEREFRASDRDATIKLEEVEVQPLNEGTKRVHPDLIDAFIVVVVAAAIDIFIFAMATQFINNPAFQKLPYFITDAYTAMWTSVVAGGAGIGAAVVKAFTRKPGVQTPNYVIYVISTAILFAFIIIAIAYVSSQFGSNQRSSDHPTIQATYQVCVGEYRNQCPPTAVYLYCGQSVADWAKKECSSYTAKQISSRDGNKCGYAIVQVTCTTTSN